MEAFSFDWSQALTDFIRVLIAFALALPIGWERAVRSRSIGLRTFPIVAMASCGFILVVHMAPGVNAEADARILQGLLAHDLDESQEQTAPVKKDGSS